ncbi:unnamed protein product [Bemisia tabaci]|uniref:Uncharacterized protein n=1 Tax=Bemisia tabaci TaxID=7038 RepID=A0A9P0ADM7_BEMTA|nr:unnamed protein product [Bemisia tabaci]
MQRKVTTVSTVAFILHLAVTSVTPAVVTLWKDKHFSGQKCDVEVNGCKPVCPGMEGRASSLKGDAPCVNFYRRPDCKVFMRTWHSTDKEDPDFKYSSSQDSIVSVGDCKQPTEPNNTVTFFENKNYKGRYCNLPVKGCQPMCSDLAGRASSATATANCVKLFERPNCEGYVGRLDVWGDASRNFYYTNYQDRIRSISDCENNTATFYEDKQFQGKSCEIQVKGCQPMCPSLVKKASSARGNSVCTKVYSDPNCVGYLGILTMDGRLHPDFSRAYYTRTPYQDRISSISDCVGDSVTFFEHKNFRGKQCTLKLTAGCQRMCSELDKQASSIRSGVHCVRYYFDANCTINLGHRLFGRSTEERNFKYTSLQDSISSVKNCEDQHY